MLYKYPVCNLTLEILSSCHCQQSNNIRLIGVNKRLFFLQLLPRIISPNTVNSRFSNEFWILLKYNDNLSPIARRLENILVNVCRFWPQVFWMQKIEISETLNVAISKWHKIFQMIKCLQKRTLYDMHYLHMYIGVNFDCNVSTQWIFTLFTD